MRRVLFISVASLALAACGGGGSQHISLAQAATKSAAASSMKLDMTMAMTTPQLSKPLTLTATGVEDNTNHRAQINLDMSTFATSLSALGGKSPFKGADWKGQEIADFSNGHAVMYMNLPFLTKLIPQHKPWIKIDLSAVGKSVGLDFSQFTSLSSNPAQEMDWLRSTSGSIQKVGTETIDGVSTTHYYATIDLAKYPNLVPPARRAAMRQAVNSLVKLAHVSSFPVDAWVGDDGYVRKLRMSMNETIQGQGLGMDITMRFHDFGSPVNISLPPASQTLDATKLASQGKP